MKRLLSIGIILLFVGLSISSSTGLHLEKQTTRASFDGNTLYVGGSGPGNYSRIQDAIDDASDGDTVFVYDDSSPYWQDITLLINKTINLIGENKATTIIENEYGSGNDVINISADWVNISNFTIRYNQIRMCSNNNTITNNTVFDSGCDGIHLDNSNYNIITNNIFFYSWCYGIRLYHSKSNTIIGNTFSNNYMGINNYKSYNSTDNIIYHNNFINNTQNAYDNGNNTWDNGYPSGGNYWDDYTGKDKDGDGIGDTPYLIPGGDNVDRYPLMKPLLNDSNPPITTISRDPPEPDGDNGYYVNSVYVTLKATDSGIGVKAIYFRIAGGKWYHHYGIKHSFGLYYDCLIDGLIECYSVDFFDNIEKIQSISISMDQLPPEGDIEFYTYKEGFWWTVCFTITVWDNCSGLCDRIEFFINDGLQEIIEGSGPDYVFTLQWSETLRNHKGFFYIYDRAGNLLILEVNFSDVESFLYSQSYNKIFWKWLDRFPILNQFMIRIIERMII